MKKLPIGIQSFFEIRTDNYVYVDKTHVALELIELGKYYFLSRPRRFGKSLFLDTLKHIFSGSKDLFEGLHIYDKYDWNKTFPVFNISFAGGVVRDAGLLDEKINNQLTLISEKFDITFQFDNISDRFQELIRKVSQKTDKKVVVLIDEYDKPILDNLTNPEIAVEMREGLKNLYSAMKDCDEYLKFVFLTGVSKFSKVSIFSGLNNLQDITTDKRYGTICGYTQTNLEGEFGEYLKGCNLDEIKKWYNGYSWLGESVYNPFDILLFFAKDKEFQNYWFETGTPSFLIDLLYKKNYYIPAIDEIKASEKMLGSFDVKNIEPETLLFQSGYLTIVNKRKLGARFEYVLSYPNLEVKYSLNDHLLSALTDNSQKLGAIQSDLYKALLDNDLDHLKTVFYSFFASIPNDWYRKNAISNYEGYYASIFYCYFASLGLDVTPEDATNHGKIDMTLKFKESVYIFEFKVTELVKENNTALNQIKQKRYYEKYLDYKEIYLVGIEFSKDDKNIAEYQWEKYQEQGQFSC